MAFIAIIQCIVGRLILMAHSAAVIGFTTVFMDNNLYIMLGALALFQLAELLFMVVKRRGYEYKWLSMSTLCYLMTVVPAIWFVETRILTNFQTSGNATVSKTLEAVIPFDTKLSFEILKQTLLLVIMIHRWVIPRGALTRNALSQLLFVFFAMASDIMELFELFEEELVMKNGAVGYAILGVWTLSLTQLCMVLTNTRSAVRARAAQLEADEDFQRAVGDDPPGPNCCYSTMATDLWSVLFTLFVMDIPFLCVRMWIIVKLKVITYGILFFTVKNMLVICLSIYRFFIICCGRIDDDGDMGQKPPAHLLSMHTFNSGKIGINGTSSGNKVVPLT